MNCGFHCWRVSPPFIVMFQAQSATRGVRGMCPLKAGKPGARIRRAARLSTFVHTNVLLANLCDRKKSLRQWDPLQPIAAGTIIQIKLNWISNRQSFVSQVGMRLILDHGGPKIPVIIPDKLSGINKCQKMGGTFDVNRPFSQAIDVNLGVTSRPPKTLPRS